MRWTTICSLTLGSLLFVTASAQADDVLELTGTLRDFSDTHPDMQRYSSGGFPLVTGMVKNDLGEDGRPVLNIVNATVVVGEEAQGNAMVTATFDDGGVNVSATSEMSWVRLFFTDDSKHKINTSGTSGYFAVPDSMANKTLEKIKVRMYPDDVQITKTLNKPEGAGQIPDVWRIDSPTSFTQWFKNVEGVNQSTKHSIKLADPDGDGVYRYEASKHNGQSFFPLDGKLMGNQGRSHNYHFTYNIHTKFTYTNPADRDRAMTFSFSGDDDVWVYINKKLVVDIGGVHPEKYASVNVDDMAQQLGLEPGKTYDFHFFFAERHTTESNFTIETSIQFLSPLYD